MEQRTAHILQRVLDVLDEGGALNSNGKTPVVKFMHPHELKTKLDLALSESGAGDADLEVILRSVVEFSVKTSHRNFHNQLYAGVDRYGLAGSWISESLNTNQYTFEVAPVFTLTEQIVLERVLLLIGFEQGDGIFAPGGSVSNMYGMVLARFKSVPDVKTKGVSGMRLVAFTSQDAHYSIEKGAHWLGIGTDNLVKVRTDERGRMIPSELERSIQKCIAEGGTPFFVNATAGTTVLGAFDPLVEVAAVCAQFNVWLHVDACWGGSLLLSTRHRHRLRGLNNADSVSWNPHKMLGAPLQCSMFLVKHRGLLHACNCVGAKYLFQQDKFYDVSYDTGDKSVQCGRKVDAFKLWTMWKARGNAGLRELVDNAVDCAHYFQSKIANRAGFRLVLDEFECTNICFWYIPERLRDQPETAEWWQEMHRVAPDIKERLIMRGSLMVGYTPLTHKGFNNFFRVITTCQPPPTYADMDHIVHEIESLGAHA